MYVISYPGSNLTAGLASLCQLNKTFQMYVWLIIYQQHIYRMDLVCYRVRSFVIMFSQCTYPELGRCQYLPLFGLDHHGSLVAVVLLPYNT